MKVITLYQPHATLMVIGAKKVETRPRKWSHIGPVIIHAGLFKGWLNLCGTEPFKSALDRAGLSPAELSFGALIGQIYMTGCVTTQSLVNSLSEQEKAFGNYAPGRYAYTTENQKHLMFDYPIKAKGSQGIWSYNDAL